MNLEDKLTKQFTKFSLKSPNPKQDHPWILEHLHADFIELRTLFWDKTSFVTLQDAISFYKDNNIDVDFKKGTRVEDQLASEQVEIDEAWNSKFLKIFSIIEEREIIYGEDYPFVYDKEKIKIKTEITDNQKVYLYLLISSNLNNFSSLQDILTSEFESLSKFALSQYLPSFIVEEFGKNSEYTGNTISKIKALSEKLKIKYREDQLKNIAKTASQEKGLDIVGWAPFEDELASMLVVLAQCACGKDWTKKKSDTTYYSDSYLDFIKLKPTHAMFIPYGLVHYDVNFFQSDRTNSRLIFERKRIVTLMKKNIEKFKELRSYSIVDRCIEFDAIEV